MTSNELPVCPRCGQEYLRRVRFRGLDEVYLTCLECDALWVSHKEHLELAGNLFTDYDSFLSEHGLVGDDAFWIDLPLRVGQIIRLRSDPDTVGEITGLADRDGRAYDVEVIDSRGRTTYSGRMNAGTFYPASEVWQRRFHERRSKGGSS